MYIYAKLGSMPAYYYKIKNKKNLPKKGDKFFVKEKSEDDNSAWRYVRVYDMGETIYYLEKV